MKQNPKPKKAKLKSPQEYDVSTEALAEAEQRIGELTLHLQKLQAEFENYKKTPSSRIGRNYE